MSRDPYQAILRAAKRQIGIRLSAAECAILAARDDIRGNVGPSIEWRKIPGYEAYEVSERGDVRHGYRVLKQTAAKRSHHSKVSVYDAGQNPSRQGVHRLVALAFIGPPPEGKPFACHKNGRAWENDKDNIYWGSHADNTADMVRHASLIGRGITGDLHQ